MSNPKTEDGITVELGMPVWVLYDYPSCIERNIVYGIFQHKVQWKDEDACWYIGSKLTRCYGSHTAALQALKILLKENYEF